MEFKSENVLHITQEDISAGNFKGRVFPNVSVVIIHGQSGTLDVFKKTEFYLDLLPGISKANPIIIITEQ